MTYPAALYPRKVREPKPRPAGEFLLTWGEGTQVRDFHDIGSALAHAEIIRIVRGVTDCALTTPDDAEEVVACACGCGRLLRETEGYRLSGAGLWAGICYYAHPAVVGGVMAAITADERANK